MVTMSRCHGTGFPQTDSIAAVGATTKSAHTHTNTSGLLPQTHTQTCPAPPLSVSLSMSTLLTFSLAAF